MTTHQTRKSVVLIISLWGIVALIGLFLGCSFNSAHFDVMRNVNREIVDFLSLDSKRYGPEIVPYSLRVFQAFLVLQIAVSAACLVLTARWITHSRRLWVLLSGILMPVIFYLVALVMRPLSKMGIVEPAAFDPSELSRQMVEGETAEIGFLRLTRTRFGLGIENLVDQRSVSEIFSWDVRSAWVNHPVVCLVATILSIGLIVRAVQSYVRAREGAALEAGS